MNAKDLIRDWIAYAKANGISAAGNSGRSPTVGDVTEFMKNKGFDEAVLTSILDQIDTTPVNDTTKTEPDIDDSDDQEDAWWDQESGPNAYDPEYRDDTEYDISDEDEQGTDDRSESDDGVDRPNPETGSDVGSVRDIEDEGDEDTVDQETKQQELMSAKRIIKRLSKAQQRQLYRELNNV